jgi:hypothetical protein
VVVQFQKLKLKRIDNPGQTPYDVCKSGKARRTGGQKMKARITGENKGGWDMEVTLVCEKGHEEEEFAIGVGVQEDGLLDFLATSGWHFCEGCGEERSKASQFEGQMQLVKALGFSFADLKI